MRFRARSRRRSRVATPSSRQIRFVAIVICVAAAASGLLQAAPKGEPSDEMIYDRVIRNLVNDRELKTNSLSVTVQDAVVTVTGQVANEKLRRRVTKVVKGTKGVAKVLNEVTVRQ